MRLLTISGSLRAHSSNTTVLEMAATLAPDGVVMVPYTGLAELPHFNPDLDAVLDDPRLPEPVRALRAEVGRAGGILISTPEYAHGVPGSLKNALDWLVGSSEFPGIPVALINTAPRSHHAQESLAETLRTMSAELVEGSPFIVQLPRMEPGAPVPPETSRAIGAAVTALVRAAASRAGGAASDRPAASSAPSVSGEQ